MRAELKRTGCGQLVGQLSRHEWRVIADLGAQDVFLGLVTEFGWAIAQRWLTAWCGQWERKRQLGAIGAPVQLIMPSDLDLT